MWSGGRHNRGKGFVADIEKYNAATLLGWRVLRFNPRRVETGEAIRQARELLHAVRAIDAFAPLRLSPQTPDAEAKATGGTKKKAER